MSIRREQVSESPLLGTHIDRRISQSIGNKGLVRALSIVALIVILGFDTSASAAPGLFGRFRRARTRNNVQRTTNYRAYNYQRNVSRSYRPAASKDPWWMSEPAFRSQRTRTLYSHLGYPNAFE